MDEVVVVRVWQAGFGVFVIKNAAFNAAWWL
jgi:hypothetical protein